MTDPNEIAHVTFTGTFARATTLVDGGWRLTFDLGIDESPSIAKLADLRNELLQIAIVPIKSSGAL